MRSEDWKPILRRVRRDPDSPAFTILEKRQTFLEEPLFVRIAGRDRTLLETWRMRLDQLLEFAVTHELGHALCRETDEARRTATRTNCVDPARSAALTGATEVVRYCHVARRIHRESTVQTCYFPLDKRTGGSLRLVWSRLSSKSLHHGLWWATTSTGFSVLPLVRGVVTGMK